MNNNIIIKKTARRKTTNDLSKEQNYIIQPNRITNAGYAYTLYQERVLTAIMYALQNRIDCSFKYSNDVLFDQQDSEWLIFEIPLKEICEPNRYGDAINAIEKMVGLTFRIRAYEEDKKKWKKIVNFMNVLFPEEGERGGHIKIQMNKYIAKYFIEMDKNELGKPISYTRFIYEIAQNARSQYTSRLYKMISSWKRKGHFIISLDDLKEQLELKRKYSTYKDFKRRILLPACNELYEKADCWFNCHTRDFEIRKGKTVTHLSFKVITPQLIEEERKKTVYAIDLLKLHFQFNSKDILSIQAVLEDKAIGRGEIIKTIGNVHAYCFANSEIFDKKSYAIKSILSLKNNAHE